MDVYESIIKGLNEAIDHKEGKLKARVTKCTVNPAPEYDPKQIKATRVSLGMSQATFALVMGVSVKTVEAWETGTNKPMGPARRLLSLINAEPSMITKFNVISA